MGIENNRGHPSRPSTLVPNSSPSGFSSPTHQHVGIPQENPLVPPHGGHPPAHAEEAPVHARDELGVPVHDAELGAQPRAHARVVILLLPRHRRAVVPQAHRHVVARAHEDVAGVGAPGEPADGVLVPLHDRGRAGGGVADVEGAYDPVDACRGDDAVVVLVPVVGEDLGGGRGGGSGEGLGGGGRRRRGRVHGYGGDEVVLCRGRGAQVVDAEVGVGRDGRDEGRVGGAERGAVGAAADGQRGERVRPRWRPDLHRAVPRAREEAVLGHRVPAHGEGLALVLVEVHHREVVDAQVEELEGPVAARRHQLVLVDLGPRQVVERIVGIESVSRIILRCQPSFSFLLFQNPFSFVLVYIVSNESHVDGQRG